MEFLKSAVASAIAKGPISAFAFGDRVDIDQSIWTLYNGTKRDDNSRCSIFSFDINSKRTQLLLARNALRKSRIIRHPGVVKVLDAFETDANIYIVTERLIPLGWHTRRKSLAEETSKWGLFNIAKTLKFLNGEAASVHGCVRTSSIFTTDSGEWKLGGFDILSSMKEDDAVIFNHGALLPESHRYSPPEVLKSGWQVIKSHPIPAVDAYDYGILIYEVFNGSYYSNDQGVSTRNVPPSMHQSYKRLLSSNPKTRLSVSDFLEQGQRIGGFFQTPLIHLTEGIESLGLKTDSEREELLGKLDDVANDFPGDYFKAKVLPELLKSVEFGGGGPQVLSVVMKIGAKLSDEEFESQITPAVVRLFASPDRAMRVCLLDNLPLVIDHLSQKIVNDKIFPQMVTGFTDVAPVVREQTLKAVLTVVPKLSERVTNGELLRYLAKTSNDEQPGIRTNTTICLGKLARNLSPNTRTKVLIAAFSRSLRDPFLHARSATLMALAATADLYSEDDCASKILPAICPSLVDKEKIVRDQANKAFDIFLQRVRKYGQSLPDSALPPSNSQTSNTSASIPRIGTTQNDTSWAGWAISSFTNKLSAANGQIQNKPTNTPSIRDAERPSSTPPMGARASTRPTSTNDSHIDTYSSNPASLSGSATPGATATAFPPEEQDVDFANEWAESEDPFSVTGSADRNTTSNVLDDGGEPDFAAWLTAQAQAKAKIKKPLPKGLVKSTKSTGSIPKTVSATGINKSTERGPTILAKAGQPRKIESSNISSGPTKKDEGEDDEGWGNEWE